MRFYIIKRHNGHKYTHVCIEMYGVRVLLVPLGNKRARLGSLCVSGSDIHIQASITFVLTEVSS